MNKFSSLSPIPGFKDWFLQQLHHQQHAKGINHKQDFVMNCNIAIYLLNYISVLADLDLGHWHMALGCPQS